MMTKRTKILFGKDLSNIKKFQEAQNVVKIMEEFDVKTASAKPKEAFSLLFEKRNVEELLMAMKFLDDKTNVGGRTDKKVDGFGKLLLGADMIFINNLFDTTSSFIEAVDVSLNIAYEKIGEKEKFNIGSMKKMLNDHILEKVQNDMKD